ncbi:hypothetical protein ACQPYK_43080 [Streptosporangium sp. CA-135522]|uniref:hypothetical protein n=1 Tax=Streptosporangium sp. CA-135522 TaxID=3240072 RepID=UPI003D9075A2
MAVPDIFRNVTRNVREALSSREGFKEKAKDLPLYVLQSALSGVGQALLIGDRVRSTIKRIAGQDDTSDEQGQTTAGEPVEAAKGGKSESGEKTEEKPARREPVIFAPRPESSAKETKTEANGAKPRPEPVIFAPARPKAAEPEAPVSGTAAPEAAATATPVTEPAEVKVAEPEATETKAEPSEIKVPEPEVKIAEPEVKAAEPEVADATETTAEAAQPETEPEAAETTAAEVEPAKAKTAKVKAPKAKKTPKAEAVEAVEAAIEVPAAVKVEVTEVEVVKPETADAALVEVTETRPAGPETAAPATAHVAAHVTEAATVPAEPMPGHGQLTIASLRARMRGKTAEQIRELLAYEQATTARAEVVRMYENRLTKLEAAE